MTAFASIVGAMVAALSAAPAVSPQIHRARVRPVAADWSTLVAVRPLGAELQRFAVQGAPMNVDTRIAVECYARASAGQSPDLAVDALLAGVYARLSADNTLGGLVSDLVPQSLDYDFDADGEATACATLTFTAVHRVQNATLE